MNACLVSNEPSFEGAVKSPVDSGHEPGKHREKGQKRTMKRQLFALVVAVVVLMSMRSAQAGSVIWGNNASSGNVNLEAFDSATGLLIPGQQFLVPNLTARNDNGRGVALLGNDIYYTTASSGNIYKTNVITHADLGIVVNTGFSGIANIATDGTFLYANDYQATNGVINKYTPAGALVGSITLTGPDAAGASSRDGFEVQNNPNILGGVTTFIANRYDGGFGPTHGGVVGAYDVYDSAGVEIISGFITPDADGAVTATGIAYDGNHYFVSDLQNNRLFEYDGLGVFVRIIDLSFNPNPPSGSRFLEDLSAVGNTTTNPGCGNNSVDPGEQCDGTDDAACPGQCLPPGDPNQCTCSSTSTPTSTPTATNTPTATSMPVNTPALPITPAPTLSPPMILLLISGLSLVGWLRLAGARRTP